MSVKTYSVDFSKKAPSNIASSILADVMELDNELKLVEENTNKVKAETNKMMLDIVKEINPHLEPLGLKIHPSPHFYTTDSDNGHLHCTVLLSDRCRHGWLGGIKIKITNPNQKVVINNKQVNKADFRPQITVERRMKQYRNGVGYEFTNVADFLEREKESIKEMYLSNRK